MNRFCIAIVLMKGTAIKDLAIGNGERKSSQRERNILKQMIHERLRSTAR